MKKLWTLFKYDAYKLVVSPSTYAIAMIFATFIGAIFISLLREYMVAEQDVPFVQMFFRYCWLSTCMAVALITMRSFSEEYKSCTFQSLFSVPVQLWQVVLAKFFAAYLFLLVLWLCTLPLFAAVGTSCGSALLEAAFASKFSIIGGLLFTALSGLFFIAIGIFASSLTENQMISSMVTFCILVPFFVYGHIWGNRSKFYSLDPWGTFSESLSVFSQMDDFCNGVLDSRAIVFYLSSCALALCLSAIAVQRKLN
ncbi:MAG: ABC transporter permease [Puniceicoccales bacterium]|jgi:ABC-2 type transport system permease protein|nr:ABC transporter permease [Puniceicoccales bacterium]